MLSKKPKTRKLKSLLGSPFQIQWVEKSAEELACFQKILRKLLPAAKLEKKEFNLYFKKGKLQKKLQDDAYKNKVVQENIYRSYLAPGYQSVLRGLESRQLCCVVFSSDVVPPLLLKVALAQCKVNNVPVLVIPDLKSITLSSLGFASMALGFKNIVAESLENPFHCIYKMVCKNPTSYSEMAQEENEIEDEEMSVDPVRSTFAESTSAKIPKPEINNVYLYRKLNGERAFIPSIKIDKESKGAKKNDMIEDFISLGKSLERSYPFKKQLPIGKTVNSNVVDEDDDNSEDSEENVFFVDSKPDKSLLKSEETKCTNNQSEYKQHKLNYKKKTTRYFDSKQEKKPKKENRPKLAVDRPNKQPQGMTKREKWRLYKEKQKMKKQSVNLQPLHIKTVASNLKKIKQKKNKERKALQRSMQRMYNK